MRSFQRTCFYVSAVFFACLTISCAHQSDNLSLGAPEDGDGDAALTAQQIQELEKSEGAVSVQVPLEPEPTVVAENDAAEAPEGEESDGEVALLNPSESEIVAANAAQNNETRKSDDAMIAEIAQAGVFPAPEAPAVQVAQAAPEVKVAEPMLVAQVAKRASKKAAVHAPKMVAEVAPVVAPKIEVAAAVPAPVAPAQPVVAQAAPVVAPTPEAVVAKSELDVTTDDYPLESAKPAPVGTQTNLKNRAQLASGDLSQFILQNLFLVTLTILASCLAVFIVVRRGKGNSNNSSDI